MSDRSSTDEDSAETTKETWIDWLPSDAYQFEGPSLAKLIDRTELLRILRDEVGLDILPRTLRLWEQQGVVPGPIRRWHDGAVRALYADWVVDLVADAAEGRRAHRPAAEIRAQLKTQLPDILANHFMVDKLHDVFDVFPTLEYIASKFSDEGGRHLGTAKIIFYDDADKETLTFHVNIDGRTLTVR